MEIRDIEKLIAAGDFARAEAEINAGIADEAQQWYLRGRIAWKKGDKTAALACYERGADLDPDGPAAIALEQTRDIMDFFNKDLYNP